MVPAVTVAVRVVGCPKAVGVLLAAARRVAEGDRTVREGEACEAEHKEKREREFLHQGFRHEKTCQR